MKGWTFEKWIGTRMIYEGMDTWTFEKWIGTRMIYEGMDTWTFEKCTDGLMNGSTDTQMDRLRREMD